MINIAFAVNPCDEPPSLGSTSASVASPARSAVLVPSSDADHRAWSTILRQAARRTPGSMTRDLAVSRAGCAGRGMARLHLRHRVKAAAHGEPDASALSRPLLQPGPIRARRGLLHAPPATSRACDEESRPSGSRVQNWRICMRSPTCAKPTLSRTKSVRSGRRRCSATAHLL